MLRFVNQQSTNHGQPANHSIMAAYLLYAAGCVCMHERGTSGEHASVYMSVGFFQGTMFLTFWEGFLGFLVPGCIPSGSCLAHGVYEGAM